MPTLWVSCAYYIRIPFRLAHIVVLNGSYRRRDARWSPVNSTKCIVRPLDRSEGIVRRGKSRNEENDKRELWERFAILRDDADGVRILIPV